MSNKFNNQISINNLKKPLTTSGMQNSKKTVKNGKMAKEPAIAPKLEPLVKVEEKVRLVIPCSNPTPVKPGEKTNDDWWDNEDPVPIPPKVVEVKSVSPKKVSFAQVQVLLDDKKTTTSSVPVDKKILPQIPNIQKMLPQIPTIKKNDPSDDERKKELKPKVVPNQVKQDPKSWRSACRPNVLPVENKGEKPKVVTNEVIKQRTESRPKVVPVEKKEEPKVVTDDAKQNSSRRNVDQSGRPDPTEKKRPDVQEKVTVPSDRMGYVAGSQFSNVIRLQKTYGVEVILPKRGGSGTESEIILKGSEDGVADAKEDILYNLPNWWMAYGPVDEYYIPRIIGARGERIRALSEKYRVRITFEGIEGKEKEKEVVVRGLKGACSRAIDEIEDIIAECKEKYDARAAKTYQSRR